MHYLSEHFVTENIIRDSEGELAISVFLVRLYQSVFINKNGHNKNGHFRIQVVHIADDALEDCNRS